MDGMKITKFIINAINKRIKDKYKVDNFLEDCLVLDSSSVTKYSSHVIFQKIVFCNNEVCGQFVREFIASLSEQELEVITVNDKHGIKVSIIDTSVYSKNRMFRLVYSSKYGQQRPLLVSEMDLSTLIFIENNKDTSGIEDKLEEFVFYSSLITFFKEPPVILDCQFQLIRSKFSSERKVVKSEASFKSKFPLVDDCVSNIVGGYQNIRNIHGRQGSNVILYEIKSFKYCQKAERCHSNNNIYFLYNSFSNVLTQSCHNEKCNKKDDFRIII